METTIKELIIWNEGQIKKLTGLSEFFSNNIATFGRTKAICFEKLNRLSNAWCNFPFGRYAEVYYYTLDRPPIGKEYNVEMGTMVPQPTGWVELTTQQKDEFENGLPNRIIVMEQLTDFIPKLNKVIKDVIDENYVLKSLYGFEELYLELEKQNSVWGYSLEAAMHTYFPKNIMSRDPLAMSRPLYPYHARLMGHYDVIYSDLSLMEHKMEDTIRILKRINKSLPLAEAKMRQQNDVKPPAIYMNEATVGTLIQGRDIILKDLYSHVNSGKMNINHEKKTEIENIIKELLTKLKDDTTLTQYQKIDANKDLFEITSELEKTTGEQNKDFIEHSLNKIWNVTKDVVSLGASLVTLATALGITLK